MCILISLSAKNGVVQAGYSDRNVITIIQYTKKMMIEDMRVVNVWYENKGNNNNKNNVQLR